MTHRLPLIAVLVLLLGVAAQAADKPKGYLTPVQTPDTKLILPPAPAEGTPRYDADRAIFKATRRFSTDAARWAMAQNDDHYESTYLAADFACAVGADFAPAKAPKLWATVDRANVDLLRAMADVKNFYKRQRPFLIDTVPPEQICIAITDEFAKSYDYPSGHNTMSWALGLILAELVPDRATQILARARAYGESRVVCGVHNASAAENGRTEASIVVAALHGVTKFREDMKAARKEVDAARKTYTRPPTCDAEDALVAVRPY